MLHTGVTSPPGCLKPAWEGSCARASKVQCFEYTTSRVQCFEFTVSGVQCFEYTVSRVWCFEFTASRVQCSENTASRVQCFEYTKDMQKMVVAGVKRTGGMEGHCSQRVARCMSKALAEGAVCKVQGFDSHAGCLAHTATQGALHTKPRRVPCSHSHAGCLAHTATQGASQGVQSVSAPDSVRPSGCAHNLWILFDGHSSTHTRTHIHTHTHTPC